jgi:hypothetical protein
LRKVKPEVKDENLEAEKIQSVQSDVAVPSADGRGIFTSVSDDSNGADGKADTF